MELVREWKSEDMEEFRAYLLSLQDASFRDFYSRLVTSKYEIIGIKLPVLRSLAGKISRSRDCLKFVELLKPLYAEEVMIAGLIITGVRLPIKNRLFLLSDFLQYVDNWAACDTPAMNLKEKDERYFEFLISLSAGGEYEARFSSVALMTNFLDDAHKSAIERLLESDEADYPYVHMARAWLLTEMYVKYGDDTIAYIEDSSVPLGVLKKSISKVRDTRKLSAERKEKFITAASDIIKMRGMNK